MISKKMFDWAWDNFKPTKEALQNMVYEESLYYHPEQPPQQHEQQQQKKPKRDIKDYAYGSRYRFYQ